MTCYILSARGFLLNLYKYETHLQFPIIIRRVSLFDFVVHRSDNKFHITNPRQNFYLQNFLYYLSFLIQ